MMLHNFMYNLLEIDLSKKYSILGFTFFHAKQLTLQIQQDEATQFPIVINFDAPQREFLRENK